MKKQSLRGILLGTSMALLLAGGVALAAGVSISANKYCIECDPTPDSWEDEYNIKFTIGGWDPQSEEVCWGVEVDGETWAHNCQGEGHRTPVIPGSPCTFGLWVNCDDLLGHWWWDCRPPDVGGSSPGGEVGPANPIPSKCGEWTAYVYEQMGGEKVSEDKVTFLFACEGCDVAMFVPEPGTMVLLGGGLAGLAGYAMLRWRTV